MTRELIEDYLLRFPGGPQPESSVEVVNRCGQKVRRLTNCNGVLAVYDAQDQYVDPAERPRMYEES